MLKIEKNKFYQLLENMFALLVIIYTCIYLAIPYNNEIHIRKLLSDNFSTINVILYLYKEKELIYFVVTNVDDFHEKIYKIQFIMEVSYGR